jgi:plasmid stabilization system protein ParE
VEADVDYRLGAFDLLVPRCERIREALANLLEAEVDVARRATEGGRNRPRGEVVAGDRPTERHLHVGVRVDRPRDNVLAARVDHLVRLHVERLPDEGDPLVVDEYVPNVVVGGGDDVTALDQYRHLLFAPLSINTSLGP